MSMGKYFIDLLKNSSDPRLPHYAGLDASGDILGQLRKIATQMLLLFGSYFAGSASTSNIIFSYSEIKFIEAEAQFRLGNTVGAQAALKTAVSASLIDVTGTDNPVFCYYSFSCSNITEYYYSKYSSLFTKWNLIMIGDVQASLY